MDIINEIVSKKLHLLSTISNNTFKQPCKT